MKYNNTDYPNQKNKTHKLIALATTLRNLRIPRIRIRLGLWQNNTGLLGIFISYIFDISNGSGDGGCTGMAGFFELRYSIRRR